jgi:hypothetical protein
MLEVVTVLHEPVSVSLIRETLRELRAVAARKRTSTSKIVQSAVETHLRVLRADALVGDEPLVRLAPKHVDPENGFRGFTVGSAYVVGGRSRISLARLSREMVERLTPAIDRELRLLWAEEAENGLVVTGPHRLPLQLRHRHG